MKKSWFHYSKDILLGIFTFVIAVFFLVVYLESLYDKQIDVVVVQILSMDTHVLFSSASAAFLFALAVYLIPLLVVKRGISRQLIREDAYNKAAEITSRLSIITFITIISVTGLNEAQFSLITGFVAFFALLWTPFFRK